MFCGLELVYMWQANAVSQSQFGSFDSVVEFSKVLSEVINESMDFYKCKSMMKGMALLMLRVICSMSKRRQLN